MKYIAEQYHRTGIKFLVDHPTCGLFADPGTGKTGMTLAAFTAMKAAGLVNRMLVVAPRLVCHNVWPNEVEKFDQFNHISVAIFHGEDKDIRLVHEFIDPKADIVLVNPESLKWMLTMLPAKWFTRKRSPLRWPWDMLVIDESSKFKNHGSVRFKELKPFLPLFNRRVILTGTPTPHSLADLWAQMFIVDMGKTFGQTITGFRDSYFQIDNPKYYTYKLLPGAAGAIHRAIAPSVLRFDESVFKLPERVINDVRVTLNEKSRKIYDDMERELFAEIDGGDVSAPNASSKYLLCRQIANGRMYDPALVQPDGDDGVEHGRKIHRIHGEKLEALDNILDELQGKPALVAYYFRHDLTALTAHLEKKLKLKRCPFIGAGATMADINKHIEDWNAGRLPVLVVHPASMAHGLNLQSGGNDLVFYGLTDNLEDYLQLMKRLHRRGVVGQVRVHRIIATKTMDEAVIAGLDSKASTQTELLNAVKQYRATHHGAMVAPGAAFNTTPGMVGPYGAPGQWKGFL